MQNNFIVIENLRESDLLKAVQDLANLYADTGYTDDIKLYRKKANYSQYLVVFTNLPDFDRFAYFVNYLYYPFDLENFKPVVKGFYQTKNISKPYAFKIGDWLMLFMTEDHTDYDEVSLVNELNETYNFDFGGRAKKQNQLLEPFEFVNFELNDFYHVKTINPEKNRQPLVAHKPWWKFW